MVQTSHLPNIQVSSKSPPGHLHLICKSILVAKNCETKKNLHAVLRLNVNDQSPPPHLPMTS